ncbi:enoyl-CoA hydratase/isomerase family protein [Streptomyces xanthochromogenes]|uniref:enoyl-CoA hydratase/isomerase family protein n=2 Tax=Streptomyces TaxID=1883 RepID=UPI0037A055B8
MRLVFDPAESVLRVPTPKLSLSPTLASPTFSAARLRGHPPGGLHRLGGRSSYGGSARAHRQHPGRHLICGQLPPAQNGADQLPWRHAWADLGDEFGRARSARRHSRRDRRCAGRARPGRREHPRGGERRGSLPQVTIGKIAGFARGAGNEFLMYLDMRFAAIGRSGQAQPEAVMDILPGGGGTVHMARLLGRARALELILGGELVDAELAERYGLVNRAVPANEIDAFVDRLARRIARLRPEVVAAIKATVETITPKIPHQTYAVENAALFSLFTYDMVASAHKQLAAGVQTREGERDLERILDNL